MQMEVSLSKIGIRSIIMICVVSLTWKVLNWVWLRPKRLERRLRQLGFKGNSYRLLFGDMKESSIMINEAKSKPINFSNDISPRALPFVHQTLNDYGKKSFIWIGPTPVVNIMNPQHLKDIFIRNFDFEKRSNTTNPLIKFSAIGLANTDGEKWAKHRKIINPAFHTEKLKHMGLELHQSCQEMINEWKHLVATKQGSIELDVWPSLQNLAGDLISRTAFGSNYEEGRRIFQLHVELAQLTNKTLHSVYIPGWRFLPTQMNKRVKKIDKEMRTSLEDMINKRKKAIRVDEATSDDLLGILIESNLKEIQQNGNIKNVGMSINDVIDECKLFYFVGQETTSVLLVWTMVLLSKYQDWQYRARDEILQAFGNQKPDHEGLSHLKVVNMILYEVLRLYPPVISLNRTIQKETQLGNLRLPAGVLISIPIILIQHDPELWGEDAKEFKPERFAEGISKATKGKVSYLPFGWGPRTCIGQNFAMMEAKMALSLILQNFTFELSPCYSHAPFPVITLQPQHGAHIILHEL